jgi:hypothetical protein
LLEAGYVALLSGRADLHIIDIGGHAWRAIADRIETICALDFGRFERRG